MKHWKSVLIINSLSFNFSIEKFSKSVGAYVKITGFGKWSTNYKKPLDTLNFFLFLWILGNLIVYSSFGSRIYQKQNFKNFTHIYSQQRKTKSIRGKMLFIIYLFWTNSQSIAELKLRESDSSLLLMPYFPRKFQCKKRSHLGREREGNGNGGRKRKRMFPSVT